MEIRFEKFTITQMLHQMSIEDTLRMPLDKYDSMRTLCSRRGREWQKKFKVNKNDEFIMITRIK